MGSRADEQDFERFCAARWAALFRTAYLLTGDRHQAEELLQDSLAATWPKWDGIRPGGAEAYVRRVMANRAMRVWRRRSRETIVEAVPDSLLESPSGDDRMDLWPLIRALPDRQRAVLVLRFYEDLTEAQTAELLGCAVGTVKSQQHKALRRLREQLPDAAPVLTTCLEGSR